ncbi:hypothetical protein LAZ67_11001016 [Cordylochernes scorpioides]|uniref:Peptidase aspartic putative domain-containing protein n=1 Tax=Cordylochernes scorpioides TaxID=51811 RepID=A0ABY6KYV4_9ARAC|nr:hypothetical protein LAZ67_11001016 [Cordylochernes scorpioides]
MSKAIKGLKVKIRFQIRRMDKYLTSVDEEIAGGDLHKLKLIYEGVAEIKTKTNILFDELFEQEEVDEEKEFEGCETIQDKMEKLELKLRRALEGIQSTADTKHAKGLETVTLPKFELPYFYGDVNSWFNFKEVFGMAIDQNPGLNELQKLQYLDSAVKGKAARLIRGFPVSSESYRQAWDILVSRYDNQRELAYAQLNKIFKIKQMRNPSAKALRELLNTCNESVRNLGSLGLQRNELVDVILVQFLRNRIDEDMKRQWELTQDERSFPSYENFILFLERQARSLPQGPKEYQRKESEVQKDYANVHIAINTNAQMCMACKAGHRIYNCTTFSSMPIEQKWEFVKQNIMCYNCLKKGSCKKNLLPRTLQEVRKKHHTLLHGPDKEATKTQKDAKPQICTPVGEVNNTSVEQGNETINQVLLATAQIIVEGEDGTQLICRAPLDSGSQFSLITKEICEKLGLKGETSGSSLKGIGGNPVQVSSVDLTFRSIYRSEKYETIALVMEVLTTEIPNFKLAEPTWIMQRGLELADPLFHISAPIDIILGADMYAYLMHGEKKMLGKNRPIAMKSKLGWILMGQVDGSLSSNCNGGPCSLAVQTTSELDGLVRNFRESESEPSLQDQNPREENHETYCQKTYSRSCQGRNSVKLLFGRAHQNSSIPASKSPIVPLGGRSGEGVLRRTNLDSRRSFRETNRQAGPSSLYASRSELGFSGGGKRANATIISKLRLHYQQNPRIPWPKLLQKALEEYRSIPHSITKMPPVYLLFGITPSYINKLTRAYPPIEEARRIANENTGKLHLKLVKSYNESHKTPNLKIGDEVLIRSLTNQVKVYLWYKRFKYGPKSIADDSRSGRPLTSTTDREFEKDVEFSSTSLHLGRPLKVLTKYRQSWSRQSGKPGNVHTKNEDTVALRKFRAQIKVELGAKDGEIEEFLLTTW